MMAAILLGGPVCASPNDSMPPIPPADKKISDYTVHDIVGCVFGQNKAQPKEHPLRVKDPGAKLKAEWPGAKVAANIDIILPYILLAEKPKDDDPIGHGIYWILVDGVSPRMVTILLTWPEFRAGFAHGETLEIRVCGRGLSCMMARGDGGKGIFIAKDDHLLFLYLLGEVCRRRSWRVQQETDHNEVRKYPRIIGLMLPCED